MRIFLKIKFYNIYMININHNDVGAEIISILTKGMYKDPKDALREYIQNSVDAKAKNVEVKIRRKSIVIIDDGLGMDKDKMRNAVRVGISEKNPNENVGFMSNPPTRKEPTKKSWTVELLRSIEWKQY